MYRCLFRFLSPLFISQESQRMVQFGSRREARVEELEGEVERLRSQQELLKRKHKAQTDKKARLEVCIHV